MTKNTGDIPACTECGNKESIFCCLSYNEKEVLSTNKSGNYFKKGQVIFYENNYPHGFYCIHKGKVKISKIGNEGKEQVVRFATTGELLGYRSVFSGEAYQATATAMEDSYVCHISSDSFYKVLKMDNKLSLDVIKLLSSDLKSSEQKVINISQKSVKERIAETLLLMKNKFGCEDDGKTLAATLTRTEIGDIAGTTTETTIRTLSILKKEGVLNLEGKKIIINDLNQLIRVANIMD